MNVQNVHSPTRRLRLLIADDHAILRGGLKQIIATAHDLEVVGEAASSQQSLAQCDALQPDLLLLDLMMPGMNGIELLQQLRNRHPRLPILILSMNNEKQIVSRAIRTGAQGYLTKDIHPEVMLSAIRTVAGGGRFVDPALVEAMVFDQPHAHGAPAHALLSEREFQIFKLLLAGRRISEIGSNLNLSPKTVSTYKQRLMEKLNIANNAELIRYALEHDIKPDSSPLDE